jgi:transcription termination factor Rho
MYDILELNQKLLPELREIAKDLKIKKVESFKKQDLIYKILDTQAIQEAETKNQQIQTQKQEKPQEKQNRPLGLKFRFNNQQKENKQEDAPQDKQQENEEIRARRPRIETHEAVFKNGKGTPHRNKKDQKEKQSPRHEQIKAIINEYNREKLIVRDDTLADVNDNNGKPFSNFAPEQEPEVKEAREVKEVAEIMEIKEVKEANEAREEKPSKVEPQDNLPAETPQQPSPRPFIEKQQRTQTEKAFEFEGIITNTGVLEIMPDG